MDKILGYNKQGEPIYPIPTGMMATAAIVSCSNCYKIIRSMGGPIRDALCVHCWETSQKK